MLLVWIFLSSVFLMLLGTFAPSEIIGLIVKCILLILGAFGIGVACSSRIRPQLIKLCHFKLSRPFWTRKRKLLSAIVLTTLSTTWLSGFIIARFTDQPKEFPYHPGLRYYRENVSGAEVHLLEVNLREFEPRILLPSTTAFGKTSLLSLAETENDIYTAINGDFFDEGGPQGFLASFGRYTTPNRDRSALEFLDHGRKAQINLFRFSTTACVNVNGDRFPVRGCYNTSYIPGMVGIYTASRGIASGARRTKQLIQARVAITSGIEGDLRLKDQVTEVIENPTKNLAPGLSEAIVVAGNESSEPKDIGPYSWAKRCLNNGASVTIDLPVTPAPSRHIISGGPELLAMGEYVCSESRNPKLAFSRTARTAVGITQDQRNLILIVVEGPPKWWQDGWINGCGAFIRASFLNLSAKVFGLGRISRGMTLQELSRYLRTKGADAALNLDGGSSSSMMIAGSFMNNPMELRHVKLASALGFSARQD